MSTGLICRAELISRRRPRSASAAKQALHIDGTLLKNGWRHNYFITANASSASSTAQLNIGNRQLTFTKTGGVYTSDQGTGEIFTANFSTGIYTYTATDGTQIIFDEAHRPNGSSFGDDSTAVADSITNTNGRKTTFHYKQIATIIDYDYGGGIFSFAFYATRLSSVNNNAGYQLKYDYVTDTISDVEHIYSWQNIAGVTAINNAVEYCDPDTDSCSLSGVWPHLAYAYTVVGSDVIESATYLLARETTYKFDSNGHLVGIRRPVENAASETGYGVEVDYDGNGRVDTVTYQPDVSGGYERDYSWTLSGGDLTAVATDVLGRTTTMVTDVDEGVIRSSRMRTTSRPITLMMVILESPRSRRQAGNAPLILTMPRTGSRR